MKLIKSCLIPSLVLSLSVPVGGTTADPRDQLAARPSTQQAITDLARRESVRAKFIDQLYARDAQARTRATPSVNIVWARAASQFAKFVHPGDEAARGETEDAFLNIAKLAPAYLDYGDVEITTSVAQGSANLDGHLRDLSRDLVGAMIAAGYRGSATYPTGTGAHLRHAFRVLIEAYALAANTLGDARYIRHAYLHPGRNRALILGLGTAFATGLAITIESPTDVQVVLAVATVAAIVTYVAITLREKSMARSDRPLDAGTPHGFRARFRLPHRADHADAVIAKFWTYVGRQITEQASAPVGSDPELLHLYNRGAAAAGNDTQALAPAIARSTVRRRLADLDLDTSVGNLCDRVLRNVDRAD